MSRDTVGEQKRRSIFDLFIAFQPHKPDGLDQSITLSSGNVLFRVVQLGCTVMAGDRRLSSNRSSREWNLSCDKLSRAGAEHGGPAGSSKLFYPT
jgi:hypothetical protein